MTRPGADVIGGVDTHGATHHAAALDAATGKLFGDQQFPTTPAGYRALLGWLRSFGQVEQVGIEGTGSYGAGLFRWLAGEGIAVVEVDCPNRRNRRLQGKSDPIDAITAARAVLAGTARTTPKPRTGPVEAIRILRTTRASAVKARTAAINQISGLLYCAPDELRAALTGLARAAQITRCARLRIDDTALADPAIAAKMALRTLARRIQALDTEIGVADTGLAALVSATAPATTAIFGAGTDTAGQLLATAGDNPHRITSEAALARLCGTAPIPASSGNTTRHRLHRGGDRAANRAIYMIVLNRLRWHQPTRDYLARRTAQGKDQERDHPLPQTSRRTRDLPNTPRRPTRTRHHRLTMHRSIHRLVEADPRIPDHEQWHLRMGHTGLPEAIPPAYIDPERRPRRHHRLRS